VAGDEENLELRDMTTSRLISAVVSVPILAVMNSDFLPGQHLLQHLLAARLVSGMQFFSNSRVTTRSLDNTVDILTLSPQIECRFLRPASPGGTFGTSMNAVPYSRNISNFMVGTVFLLAILVVGLVAFFA
jgi:hypothetical protein